MPIQPKTVLIPKEGVGKKEKKNIHTKKEKNTHRVDIFMRLAVGNVQIEPEPANK